MFIYILSSFSLIGQATYWVVLTIRYKVILHEVFIYIKITEYIQYFSIHLQIRYLFVSFSLHGL